jgi:hypothetical protein
MVFHPLFQETPVRSTNGQENNQKTEVGNIHTPLFKDDSS